MTKKKTAALAGLAAFALVAMAGCGDDDDDSGSERHRPRRRRPTVTALQRARRGRGPGEPRGLGRLRRERLDRPRRRLGDRLRGGDRLQGQRQDRQHLRRDGAADEDAGSTTACRPRATPRCGSSPAATSSPVNTDLIPNYADVFPALKDKPWNSVNGVPYGVPHGRGRQPARCGTPTR